LGAYDRQFSGELQDFASPQAKSNAAIANLTAIGSAKAVQGEQQCNGYGMNPKVG
jgi:hypothetical protein